MASKSKRKSSTKSSTRIKTRVTAQAAGGPTPAEIEKLRKDLANATAGFFAAYGDIYDYMLVCPPGPIPPPKLEARVLNLAAE
jgi:hypothetical protein